MIVVGLCGGSGSGKGTVCKMFSEYSFKSVDTDAVYHEITSYNSPCMAELVSEFGERIRFSDGSLNRPVLSEIVFSGEGCKERQAKLNSITHKYVLDEVRRLISLYSEEGAPCVLVDAPMLIESGFHTECHKVLLVTADIEVRISRIIKRDGITRDRAKKRINSQKTDSELASYADYIIVNNGDINSLKNQIRDIAEKILS